MAKEPVLRRSAVPPPAAPLPDTGGLPIPKSGLMTDYTRKQLTTLGWEDGDPVPPDMAKKIAEVRKRYADEKIGPNPYNAKPGDRVKMGKTVDISELPAAARQELQDHLRTYREQVALEAQQAKQPPMRPSVQLAAQQAAAAAAATSAATSAFTMPTVEVRAAGPDFRKKPQAPPPPPAQTAPEPTAEEVVATLPPELQPQEGYQVAGVEGLASFITNPPQPPQPQVPFMAADAAGEHDADQHAADEHEERPHATDEHEERQHDDEAGGGAAIRYCPRCFWNLNHEFGANYSDDDFQRFIAALLGPTRFYKQYSLYDGAVKITLRSLTAKESTLVREQIRYDMLAGKIIGDGDYFSALQRYRVGLSLTQIEDKDGGVIAQIPPVDEIPYDKEPNQTVLVPLCDWLDESVYTSEMLQHRVNQCYRHFQRIVEAMEARTNSPDF